MQTNEQTTSDVAEPKRMSTSLTAGGSRLTIMALRRPDESATVFVTTTDIKTKKTQRGMTKKFDTFNEAIEALKELVQDAQKKGWHRSERSGGFKARPDAFTTLPAAPTATKGKK